MEEDAVDILKDDLDRHAEPDLVRVCVLKVGDQPFAAFQLNQNHDPRMGIGAGRVLGDDPGADHAAARRLLRFPVQRLAFRAHRPQRLADGAAAAAALEQQLPLVDAFPKEILVAHSSPLLAGAHWTGP